MIARKSFSEEHIRNIQKQIKGDPGLIERTIFALGLLEALERTGLDFIFKGGSSLLLLLPAPKRLSTGIDIVVKPGTDVDSYIEEASHYFPFIDKDEQFRKGQNGIVKRHFRFTYNSPISEGLLYILLDVLYEENLYESLIEQDILSSLLITEGENLKVKIPTKECILGDKITAFAPHTTGISINADKDMEIIKQFYDIAMLAEQVETFEDVRSTFIRVANAEIRYKGLDISPNDVLMDSINAAICIASRGATNRDDFSHYLKGTHDIANHIFEGGFTMESA